MEQRGVLSGSEMVKTDHPNYISIRDFGNTEFGFGYQGAPDSRGMLDIIDAYVEYTNTTNATMKWSGFTDLFFNGAYQNIPSLSDIEVRCPASYADFAVDINANFSISQPEQTDCEQFTQNVKAAYQRESFENFLSEKRADFIEGYLKQATENPVSYTHLTLRTIA